MSLAVDGRRARPVLTDPPAGVSHPLALRGSTPAQGPARLVGGALLALVLYMLLVSVTAQLVLGLTWLLRGRPGTFTDYYGSAIRYELPEGLAASHIALSMLLVISAGLVWLLHRRHPRWLVSVQPGFRWRYLVAAALIALVVLNGVLWVSMLVEGLPPFALVPGWPLMLLLVLLTSPFQAAAEEFFFRGYLAQTMGSASGRVWVGVVGPAVLFALLHGVQNPALFVDRLAFGLLAGWLVVVTGGLEAGIAAHVVNNVCAFAYALVTTGVAATKATTEITWAKAGWDLLGFGLFAVAAWWLARRMRLATRTPELPSGGAEVS